jgi:hypothetical protein
LKNLKNLKPTSGYIIFELGKPQTGGYFENFQKPETGGYNKIKEPHNTRIHPFIRNRKTPLMVIRAAFRIHKCGSRKSKNPF